MRILELRITPELSGRRVKTLLLHELHVPNSRIASLKHREGTITCNGVPCRTIDRVNTGDVLRVDIGDPAQETGMLPCAATLDIRYEDEDILVLNKPAGMAVHAIAGESGYTVPNALAAYWGTDRPFHDVNRLDRGTSGLMVIAKNGYSHDRLRRALHTESFVREYLAVCSPAIVGETMVELPIEGKPARGRFLSHWGSGLTTTFDGAIWER